eukprot:scaffold45930_cov219-Skeletonema_marinoi.AAC.3
MEGKVLHNRNRSATILVVIMTDRVPGLMTGRVSFQTHTDRWIRNSLLSNRKAPSSNVNHEKRRTPPTLHKMVEN